MASPLLLTSTSPDPLFLSSLRVLDRSAVSRPPSLSEEVSRVRKNKITSKKTWMKNKITLQAALCGNDSSPLQPLHTHYRSSLHIRPAHSKSNNSVFIHFLYLYFTYPTHISLHSPPCKIVIHLCKCTTQRRSKGNRLWETEKWELVMEGREVHHELELNKRAKTLS